ncbi:hypothetical protein D3C85_747360 [compost metagenome]
MPVSPRLAEQLGPAGHVLEAEVDPLPRQRVDGVGGVAEQHHPSGVVVVGVAAHQGEAPLAGHLETAEPGRKVTAHLGGQGLVAHGGQGPDAGRAVIPHQGAVPARQRQEGARAARGELLPGDVFLLEVGIYVDQHAVLAVLEARHPYPGEAAGERLGTIAGQHPARLQLGAVIQRQHRLVRALAQTLDRRRGVGLDIGKIFHSPQQGELHQPVLYDVAELGQPQIRRVEAGGKAVQLPGLQPAIGAQPHLLQMRPGAGLVQQRHRGLADGGDPQIQRLIRGVMFRQPGLDDPHVETLCRQQAGGGGAHHAGADDGDITLFHNLIPARGRPEQGERGEPNGA